MKSRFLSYGAGMQTFALLVMAEQGEIQIDEVVFADTGAEQDQMREPMPFSICQMLSMERHMHWCHAGSKTVCFEKCIYSVFLLIP